MSQKPPDADATIQLDGVEGVEELPPDSEPAPRPSRATPPPLPAYVSAPPAPPPAKASVGRMVLYAAIAMILGAGVLAIVMSVVAKRRAQQAQPAAAPSVINMPTVEMQDEPASSAK